MSHMFIASMRALGSILDRHDPVKARRIRDVGDRIVRSEVAPKWDLLKGAALNLAYGVEESCCDDCEDGKDCEKADEDMQRTMASKHKKFGITHTVLGPNKHGNRKGITAGRTTGKKKFTRIERPNQYGNSVTFLNKEDGTQSDAGSKEDPKADDNLPVGYSDDPEKMGPHQKKVNLKQSGRAAAEGIIDPSVKDFVSGKMSKPGYHGTVEAKKPKLGSGARFKKLAKGLSGKVRDPKAVAAAIGRKKYGAKKFAKLSHGK
jgi:hypothetical protein